MSESVAPMNRYGRTVVVDTYFQMVKENPQLKDETVGDIARMAVHRALRDNAPDFRVVPGAALIAAVREIDERTIGRVEP